MARVSEIGLAADQMTHYSALAVTRMQHGHQTGRLQLKIGFAYRDLPMSVAEMVSMAAVAMVVVLVRLAQAEVPARRAVADRMHSSDLGRK